MYSVTITINGLIASGQGGMTILELAREMGISIPTLCYDPELSPAGACRICLVEEEKTGALLAACVTPITPGMVIQTDSPRVRENRKMIVKLMLASHPESCLICDKGNRCQLRQIAADLDIGLLDLYKLPNYTGTQEVNPFLKRDLAKCILCGKCLRADQDLVVEGAIDYFQRGFAAKPATLYDQPLEKSSCTFCGTCASLCPTGALSEKGKPSLSSSLKSFSSICPYCACGCSLSLRTNGLEVVEVEPERGKKTANQVTLCARGHYGWDFLRSRDRLTSPLIKRGNKWQECFWPEALDFAAQKLKDICEVYGPDALAFFGSSKCTNEENYLFQKLARWGIGTNNIDNGSRVYGPPDPGVFGPEWGWGTMTRPMADLEGAKCILVVGANPAETAPLVAYKIKRAVRFKKSRLILIDPRWTRLAPFAQPWLRPKFGQDGLLICGFLRVILEEELFEHKQLENYFGWAEFKEEIKSYSLPEIAEITGINEQIVRDCARQLALQKPMAIVFGNGLWRKGEEYFNLGALLNLSLLTGNIGPAGGGIYPLGKESNGQGARDMGCLPDFLPGYQSLIDEDVQKKFGQVWGKRPPSSKGINAWEMFRQAQEGKIKAMYIMGENPVRSFPDRIFIEKALSKLDFLLVQDLFLTETARWAHLVLPAASFAEKEGTMTSAERRVQLMKVACEPRGKSLPDWKILAEILSRLSGEPAYTSPGEVLREINEVVPCYRAITSERLLKGNLYWPCPDVHDLGSLYFGQKSSALPQRFWPLKGRGADQDKGGEDWLLIWGTNLFHFGSGTRSSQSCRLRNVSFPISLQINAEEAEKRGLAEGSLLKITRGGRELILPVSLVKDFPPHVLFWPVSGEKAPYAELAEFPQENNGEFPFPRSLKVKIERI